MRMRYADGNLELAAQAPASYGPQRGGPPPWPFAEPVEIDAPEAKIDWAGYWRSIRKRRWAILTLAALLTLGAVLYAQSVKPVFRSTTTLLIESGKSKILSIEEVYNGVSQDREYYQTQVEILRSRDVALRTVIATRLWDEPEFDPRIPVRNWRTRLNDLIATAPPVLPWTPERLANETVGRYLGGISIEPVRLSQLVKISFEAGDRELAAKIADATAVAFIESDRDARLKLNLSATGQLQDRLSALREKLLQSEQELQRFREGAGLVSVSGSPGVAGQQMADISQRLVSARVRRTELESAFQQVERITDGDYSGVGAVITQPGLAEARARVSAASLQVEDVTRSLGEQNSKVIEARAALVAAQRQLGALSRSVVRSMRAELQAARDTERALQTALSSARSSVQGVNRQEFQLSVLEREVQTNKQLYDLLLSRTKETGVSTNLQSAVARIVDPATPAGVPLRPNRPQMVLVTLLLSLLGGALAAILRDRLTNTLQGSDEAESRLRHPVLAALPAVRDAEAASGMTRLFLDSPRSHHADGIRTARTSMLLSKFVVAHKLVLVTSALSGEGKTTFCTNLAFAHAQTKRTLLIDCDLRNPQIGARLGLPADAKGIANLVTGTADVKDCVHAISGSPLLVMPAGDLPGHPEEFLLSPQFRDALKSLANRVDIVLIDAPPVAGCSDALIIAQQVNDTIFVVKARDTPHLLATRGLERLRRAGASILGLVLTNVDAPAERGSRRDASRESPRVATREVTREVTREASRESTRDAGNSRIDDSLQPAATTVLGPA
jgi:polysaccharide biosynthesis transport protein